MIRLKAEDKKCITCKHCYANKDDLSGYCMIAQYSGIFFIHIRQSTCDLWEAKDG